MSGRVRSSLRNLIKAPMGIRPSVLPGWYDARRSRVCLSCENETLMLLRRHDYHLSGMFHMRYFYFNYSLSLCTAHTLKRIEPRVAGTYSNAAQSWIQTTIATFVTQRSTSYYIQMNGNTATTTTATTKAAAVVVTQTHTTFNLHFTGTCFRYFPFVHPF